MSRLNQIILIASTLVASWLGMQAVHESGHLLGAWLTGAQVSQVVLYPLTISRTDLSHNPSPSVVVWAGPVIGVTVPLLLWAAAAVCRLPGAFVLRFFAGFCLLANGIYIGVGSFNRVGDCGDMIRSGSESWQLRLFGLVMAPLGLWLWHRQGSHFGLGSNPELVRPGAAYGPLLACAMLLVLGLFVGGR